MKLAHLDALIRSVKSSLRTPLSRIRRWYPLLTGAIVFAATVSSSEDHRRSNAPSYQSFVTRTAAGNPVRWAHKEVVFVPVRPTAGVSAAELRKAVLAATEAWNTTLRGCNAPRIRVASMVKADTELREDGVSMIKFRTSEWCPDGAIDREHCYDSWRTALTRLYLSHEQSRADNGELREADIEVNGVNFVWTLSREPSSRLNLTGVLAHEMGHVLGLDHACTQAGDAPSPTFARSLAPQCVGSAPIRSVMAPAPIEALGSNWVMPGESEAAALCQSYASIALSSNRPAIALN